jgi:beta-mannosidase
LAGVDTVAEVRLNGRMVRRCGNSFRRWQDSVRLRDGENTLEIRLASPVREAAKRQTAQPWFVPYHAGNCPIPNGNMLRKAQCDFGWDWNIALAPSGLLEAPVLRPKPDLSIGDLRIVQDHRPGRVTLEVSAIFSGAAADVTVRFCGQTRSLRFDGGSADHSFRFVITNPELWWPAGAGAQSLHELVLEAGRERLVRRLGLREIRLISRKDRTGRSFGFRVNGRDIFAKGANWIPADALSGRITREKTRDLLTSAVQANMNMIRVWGGGRYEADWFYDLCDELGLMVWQDAMFSCALYPADEAFLAEVDAELREQAARLAHHACLALWCGDNEMIGALTWFPESVKDRDRYLVGYDRLNRVIERAIRAADPAANWWPSSPSPGPMSFGDAWHDDSSGDMHFWSVWHEGRDFDHYRDVAPRFCSEFGFQSYPSLEVIRTFADPADLNIASPVLESHQKNKGGNARIAETMFRYFRFPASFPDFVYLSQVQQGLAIKTAVSHWRSRKPHCQGMLYWQLNDTWPVCSWSSLDYGGGWKLLHHMARHFFAPVIVSAVPKAGGLDLIAVSDRMEAVDLILESYAADMEGNFRDFGDMRIAIPPDRAVSVRHLPEGSLREGEVLVLAWRDSEGRRGGDIFAPKPWKSYELRKPDLAQAVRGSGDAWQITVSAQKPAFFVALEADRPGRFTDNGFAVWPGYDQTLLFTPDRPGPKPAFTLRDLHSATCGAI